MSFPFPKLLLQAAPQVGAPVGEPHTRCQTWPRPDLVLGCPESLCNFTPPPQPAPAHPPFTWSVFKELVGGVKAKGCYESESEAAHFPKLKGEDASRSESNKDPQCSDEDPGHSVSAAWEQVTRGEARFLPATLEFCGKWNAFEKNNKNDKTVLVGIWQN